MLIALALYGFPVGTTSFSDNQLQWWQQLFAWSHVSYPYSSFPTGVMSYSPHRHQQAAFSFSVWFPCSCSTSELGMPHSFPQQQWYRELSSPGVNSEAPST